ncbi:hypothetical protein GGI42DRAFT_19466 [Trichoderma sp. SZMC 28013]
MFSLVFFRTVFLLDRMVLFPTITRLFLSLSFFLCSSFLFFPLLGFGSGWQTDWRGKNELYESVRWLSFFFSYLEEEKIAACMFCTGFILLVMISWLRELSCVCELLCSPPEGGFLILFISYTFFFFSFFFLMPFFWGSLLI